MIAVQPRLLALFALCAIAAALPPADMNAQHTNVSTHIQRATPLDTLPLSLPKAPAQPRDIPPSVPGPNPFGMTSSLAPHSRDTEQDVDAKLPAAAPTTPTTPHVPRSMQEDVDAHVPSRMVIKRSSPVPVDLSSKLPAPKRDELDPTEAENDIDTPNLPFDMRRSRIARQSLVMPLDAVADSMSQPGMSGDKDQSENTRLAKPAEMGLVGITDNDSNIAQSNEGSNPDGSRGADNYIAGPCKDSVCQTEHSNSQTDSNGQTRQSMTLLGDDIQENRTTQPGRRSDDDEQDVDAPIGSAAVEENKTTRPGRRSEDDEQDIRTPIGPAATVDEHRKAARAAHH
ncbi:hypothetical protein C8R45DRAFT_1106650 [Mycena sanguinolenta]|nr:hypothetical protein C8R45DRAFT_1106650 [Mycena sanguinolenta]